MKSCFARCPRSSLARLPSLAALAFACHGAFAAHDTTLPAIIVREAPSYSEENQVPGTTESITRKQIEESVNAQSVEDTMKYMPGLVIRKRNIADQFAPLATRTSGLGQSARSLIYMDGVLLSALTGNNNSNASPRWNLVSPELIERIDVMYGPYSAAFPGNS